MAVGDWRQRVRIEPIARPELTSVTAQVSLPAYLGLPKTQTKDVRSGTISPVNGSRIQVAAVASRELASSQVNGQPQDPAGSMFTSPPVEVKGTGKLQLQWQDRLGLTGKEPFNLAIAGHEDEAPSLVCEGLPRQKVVLDSEMLSFKVHARDDFGVKRVGIEWLGLEEAAITKPAKGERVLAAGGNDKESLDVGGTFSAKSFNIEPQLIRARVFVEDYLPNRKRVYAPAAFLYVLNPEQHAIWLTEQLNKWHRQSLEVRDREMQLYETNKQLRASRPGSWTSRKLAAASKPRPRPSGPTDGGCRTWCGRAKISCSRRPAIPSSVSDISRSGPRCCKFSRRSLPIECHRSPTCSSRRPRPPQMAGNQSAKKSAMVGEVRSLAPGKPGTVKPDTQKRQAAPRSGRPGIAAAAAREG